MPRSPWQFDFEEVSKFSRQDLGPDYLELRMRKEEIAYTASSIYILRP